jgi:putative transposase
VPQTATHPNHVWSYDFLEDRCTNGQKLRILTVVDEFTRECLAIRTERYFPAWKVQRVLEGLFAEQSAPKFLRSDNGPEFIARELQGWLAQERAESFYIDPGSPWQNAYGESFNGKFRDECLNLEEFANPAEARVVHESWRRYYNGERPHSSLGYQTPWEFKAACQQGKVTYPRSGAGALPPHPQDLSLGANKGAGSNGAVKRRWRATRPKEKAGRMVLPLRRPRNGARVGSHRCPTLRPGTQQCTRRRPEKPVET